MQIEICRKGISENLKQGLENLVCRLLIPKSTLSLISKLKLSASF